jgi:glycosyltransferase involved in cell wall biosynthesis
MTLIKAAARLQGETEENYTGTKPLVSIVVPAYNEATIIKENLGELCRYMESLEAGYRWEIIIVNDGSTDETGDLADAFARTRDNVRVLHHMYNFRLGQALRFAFHNCKGDYVVTMDLDLSYSPDHIGKLLAKIRETRAKIVIASPYMKGGKVSNVPRLRRTLSIWANRFLSLTAPKGSLSGSPSTFTGMVRAYNAAFLARLDLRAMDVDIHPEILYKAMMLRARIVEIPAHLNWSFTKKATGKQRKSSVRILSNIVSCLLSGFMFRPFMFFILPGLALMLPAIYTLSLVFTYTLIHYQSQPASLGPWNYRVGTAVAAAFETSPQSFIVSGISLMLAIQLISLGILSLQSKRYFEELFHLGSTVYGANKLNNDG